MINISKSKPLLSICIATYNRAAYIGKTLESIIPQITDTVEIVVVDGASTDTTGDVVNRYAQTCGQIRYVRLPSKGGVDQDYCKAVEHAQGRMCWLFTDDDLLKPGAIREVLDHIHKGYSLIVVNAEVMNQDFSTALKRKCVKIDRDEIVPGSAIKRLFDLAGAYMSFIGCVIIDRNVWMQREKMRYLGTEFIHVGVIFQAPLPAPALVIADPYITIRLGNAQWASRAFEVSMLKWPNLICSLAGVPEHIKRRYQPDQSWRRLKRVIAHRASGAYSVKECRRWLALENTSLCWKMGVFFIAFIPRSILRNLISLYLRTTDEEALRLWNC